MQEDGAGLTRALGGMREIPKRYALDVKLTRPPALKADLQRHLDWSAAVSPALDGIGSRDRS